MKKMIALLLSVIFVMSMTITTFAEESEPTYTLTINKDAGGHTYEAYQIFSGELAQVDNKDVLTNIQWGSSVKDGDAMLKAIQNEPKLKSLHGAKNAAQVAKGLEEFKDNSDVLDQFAKTISSGLDKKVASSTEKTGPYTISGLKAGYYLVKDKDGTQENKYDYYTKFILCMVKDQKISPKGGVPGVGKEISTTLDGDYKEVEDFGISDTVYYKWTGSLPENLNDFATYYYKFVDTLPVGISFKQIEQIYIADNTGVCQKELYNRETHGSNIPQIKDAEIKLTSINGEYERNKDGKITKVTKPETVELEFINLKGLGYEVSSTEEIVVKYSATVNQDALIKTDMKNEVKVVFDNNPNGKGRGETVPDEAHAFTFQISVDKFEENNSDKKLKDAEFVLYYETTSGDTVTKHYAQTVTSKMVEDKYQIDGKAVTNENIGNVYGWTTDKNQASILITDKKGYFRVGGLDAGEFYLEETKAPEGYNLMEKPVKVQIAPTYTKDSKDVSVKYVVNDQEQDSEVIHISNAAGTTLPSTGGIGTVIFYIAGMIFVLTSVFVFAVRKRIHMED